MTQLSKLFSPIKIGTMEVKNRIAMSPMASDFASPDGTLSDKIKGYYEARARGGTGLIIMEVTTIDELSPYMPNTVSLYNDDFIPGMKEFTDAVHSHGAKIIPQIAHPGPESLAPFFNNTQTIGPSPVLCHVTKQKCREMTIEEIKKTIEQFGDTARRAREAGFDGMELHAAHSYMLVGSFLSPLRNRRVDEYGGSIEGRLKYPLEVIDNIRAKAGEDFPIIMRISGDMLVPGGQDIRETQYIAPILAKAGIHAFEVSAGIFPEIAYRIIPPTGSPFRVNVALSSAVKAVVDVPVLAVGRINEPNMAEDILNRNEADMVVLGRAHIADPEFANKAAEGRLDDITPCIGCCQGCIAVRNAGKDMTCLINPTVGREKETAIIPAETPRKVMIAGAGPGGLEAARVAALRGHRVTLYEKEGKPGGQLNLAAVPPHKQEMCKVPKYLFTQAEKAGARIQFNTEVTPELVEEQQPDVVIIATGSEPLIPDIPGIDGKKVITAHDVLTDKVTVMPGRVLVIGGGMVGCETADAMADTGDNLLIGCTEVTVIEMLKDVALDIAPTARAVLMKRLREKGVRIITSAKVKSFLEDGVVAEINGKEEMLTGMDLIVLSMGVKPVDSLSETIRDKVPELHAVGDAQEARSALEAIAQGNEIGRMI